MWIAEFSESSNLWTQIAVQVLLDHVCLSVISTSSLHLCWCGLCASREVFASNSVISEMVRVVSRSGYDFSTFDSECIELYATVWQYSLNWGWLYHCSPISVALTLRDLKCDHTCIVDVLVCLQAMTSDQSRLPAEFKHINKRRKRKQQWLP